MFLSKLRGLICTFSISIHGLFRYKVISTFMLRGLLCSRTSDHPAKTATHDATKQRKNATVRLRMHYKVVICEGCHDSDNILVTAW